MHYSFQLLNAEIIYKRAKVFVRLLIDYEGDITPVCADCFHYIRDVEFTVQVDLLVGKLVQYLAYE